MTKQPAIHLKNARQHNLRGVDATFQHNSFTVVTGVSGSGKSSLVFDTLFAEGQRRYVESLSSYARQFMGRMKKPEVDYILGLCPAIAIEQKVNTRNPRSTVATSTEIYDYLKLLFSRIGHTFSPISGLEVKRDDVSDVVKYVVELPEESTIMILSPLNDKELQKEKLELLRQNGFSRVLVNDRICKIEDLLEKGHAESGDNFLVLDRLTVDLQDEEFESRLTDAVETAFWEGQGECAIRLDSV